MADILKKIGDKANYAVSFLETLPPNNGEMDTIRQNQEQVDALSNKAKHLHKPPHKHV